MRVSLTLKLQELYREMQDLQLQIRLLLHLNHRYLLSVNSEKAETAEESAVKPETAEKPKKPETAVESEKSVKAVKAVIPPLRVHSVMSRHIQTRTCRFQLQQLH